MITTAALRVGFSGVGLYTLNPVDPSRLKPAWFQPLNRQ
jgi:hypothetical protein